MPIPLVFLSFLLPLSRNLDLDLNPFGGGFRSRDAFITFLCVRLKRIYFFFGLVGGRFFFFVIVYKVVDLEGFRRI